MGLRTTKDEAFIGLENGLDKVCKGKTGVKKIPHILDQVASWVAEPAAERNNWEEGQEVAMGEEIIGQV